MHCCECNKIVGFAEKLVAFDRVYHSGCFKCVMCEKTLSRYEYLGNNSKPICKSCHRNNYDFNTTKFSKTEKKTEVEIDTSSRSFQDIRSQFASS